MCSYQPTGDLVVSCLLKRIFNFTQQPILQLVDDCTSGIVTSLFPSNVDERNFKDHNLQLKRRKKFLKRNTIKMLWKSL